ncbi:hypothetical protein QA612_09745 [Evansella sp. AB-P1]|uniref:hypothetical protein n=1 Tax=Evansella sp. AB-P1 TaxID=3037653 RepID=UPI00241F2074|nr:hypothetical protein [Evansella sp. AB-P1]MDG5787782.1 hypothetical protein [Evansella sp. AB-P1]
MNTQILESVLQVIFTNLFPYLAPLLFLFMVILFSDRLIDFLYKAFRNRRIY